MDNNSAIILYKNQDGSINLDVIISVGYCVKSQQGTQFRIWAISGQTPAEIVSKLIDASLPLLNMLSFDKAATTKVKKTASLKELEQDLKNLTGLQK